MDPHHDVRAEPVHPTLETWLLSSSASQVRVPIVLHNRVPYSRVRLVTDEHQRDRSLINAGMYEAVQVHTAHRIAINNLLDRSPCPRIQLPRASLGGHQMFTWYDDRHRAGVSPSAAEAVVQPHRLEHRGSIILPLLASLGIADPVLDRLVCRVLSTDEHGRPAELPGAHTKAKAR